MIKKAGVKPQKVTRELSQNGITAKIVQERWGGAGGNTVLYVNLLLTKSNANTKPTGKVYLQARTTDGQVLQSWSNGVEGQGAEFRKSLDWK